MGRPSQTVTVIRRTLEIAFDSIKSKLRSNEAGASVIPDVKKALLVANSRALDEFKEDDYTAEEEVHDRDLETMTARPSSVKNPAPILPDISGTVTTIRVSVDAAVKIEDGMFREYILYTVSTSFVTDDPSDYDSVPIVKSFKVGRRYRDFDALASRLASQSQDVIPIVPHLPPKRSLRIARNTSEDHAEGRRRALQMWLRHLTGHQVLRTALPLQEFLTAAEESPALPPPPPPPQSKIKGLGTLTTNRYKMLLQESLGTLSKQVKRITPPTDNALFAAETLFVSLQSAADIHALCAAALQGLPQCESRGGTERHCWSAVCAGAAGVGGGQKTVIEALETGILEPLRHQSASVLPVMKATVSGVKERANALVKKMQNAEEQNQSLNEAVRSDAVGIHQSADLLVWEWQHMSDMRGSTFVSEAAKFARAAAGAHRDMSASWETAKNGLLEALGGTVDGDEHATSTFVLPKLGRIPEYAPARVIDEEEEEDESIPIETPAMRRNLFSHDSSTISSCSSPGNMADAVEEARRISSESDVDYDPLSGMRVEEQHARNSAGEAFVNLHKSKPIIPPELRRRPSRDKLVKSESSEVENPDGRGRSSNRRGEKKDKSSRSVSTNRNRKEAKDRPYRSQSRHRSTSRTQNRSRSKSRQQRRSSSEEPDDPFTDVVEEAQIREKQTAHSVRKKKRHANHRVNMNRSLLGKTENSEENLRREAEEVADILREQEEIAVSEAAKEEERAEQEAGKEEKKREKSHDEPSYFTESMPTPQSVMKEKSNKSSFPFVTPKSDRNLSGKATAEKVKEKRTKNMKGKTKAPDTKPESTPKPASKHGDSAPAQSQPIKLSGGWEEVKLDDGRVYFYHRLTRQTRWEKPEGAVAEAMEERIMAEELRKREAVDKRRREREAEREKQEAEKNEKDDLSKSTEAKVRSWAKEKGVHQMLNDLDDIFEGAPTPDLSKQLHVSSTASEMKRAYMKAIRFVHPDKIGADATTGKKLLASAVFAVLNEAYERKKRVEGW